MKNVITIILCLYLQTNFIAAQHALPEESQTNQKELVLPAINSGEIKSIAITPDGKFCLSATLNETSLWDMKMGKLLRKMDAGGLFVGISDDGTRGLLGAAFSVTVFDLTTGDILGGGALPISVTSVAISPDGKIGAIGLLDTGVQIIDLENGKVIDTINGYSGSVLGLSFIKQGTVLASGSAFGPIKLIQTSDWEVIDQLEVNGIIKQIAFDQNGKYAIYNEGVDEVTWLDLVLKRGIKTITAKESFWRMPLSVSGDGKYGMTGADDGGIEIWDMRKGYLIRAFEGHVGQVSSVKISTDGKYGLSGGQDGFIKVWDLSAMSELRCLNKNLNSVSELSITPDGKYLAYGVDSILKVWDMQKGKIVQSIPILNAMPGINDEMLLGLFGLKMYSGVFISPDGKYVITSGTENSNIRTLADGKLIRTIQGIAPFSVTPDMKYGIFSSRDDKLLHYFDLVSGKHLLQVDPATMYNNSVQISPDGNYALSAYTDNTLMLWDLKTGKKLRKMSSEDGGVIFSIIMSADAKKAVVCHSGGEVEIWDLATGKILHRINKPINMPDEVSQINIADDIKGMAISMAASVTCISATPDFHYLLFGDFQGNISLFDFKNGMELKKTFPSEAGIVESISVSEDGKYAFAGYNNNTIKLWDLEKGEEMITLIPFKEDDYVLLTPEGYYSATKEGVSQLGYVNGLKYFGFEQFDLIYNRPDLVLERMGIKDNNIITAYYNAYRKRLKRMGVSENMFNNDANIPEISILNKNEIPLSSNAEKILLEIRATDEKYKLDRINIWINGAPLYGIKGYSVKEFGSDKFYRSIPVILSAGENKIEVSCLNEAGVESLKDVININYYGDAKKYSTYFIGIGVGNYKDSSYNLTYAVKDIKDLQITFPEANTTILLDEQATKENILALKQKLLQTNIEDRVIISVSGHGVLSDSLDFYFATHDMDFDHPEKRGLLFDDLENLLDSIPARKKLLMIDACHSGEVDKDEVKLDKSLLAQNGVKELDETGKGGQTLVNKNSIGMQNTFELMQSLFANVSKGTGAVVISAAGGREYALESGKWNNGVFTYCVRKALEEKAADANNNGEVSIVELKDYVSREVERLTQGRQKPTARKENLEVDWRVK